MAVTTEFDFPGESQNLTGLFCHEFRLGSLPLLSNAVHQRANHGGLPNRQQVIDIYSQESIRPILGREELAIGHPPECKARFDAIFSRRGESVGPIPKPNHDGEEIEYEPSIAPDQFPGDEMPECPARFDDENDLQPAAVTRQLPRSEVLSREDAIAAIKKEFDVIGRTMRLVPAGYAKRLRHMKRTHRINLGSLKDELDKDDVDLQLVARKYQKADIFMKGLPGDLWGNALDLLGIVSRYSVTSTTHTGLKMHEEDFSGALRPSQEATPLQPAPKPKAKANVRKRYKKKAPRILPYLKAPEDEAQ
eukprot:s889_g13.t1